MKLFFKQRAFSWFDKFDIYCENEEIVYTVKGQPSWGKKLHVLLPDGTHKATVKDVFAFFKTEFEFYIDGELIGTMRRVFNFFTPSYELSFNGWSVEGNFMEWDYKITDSASREIAVITKEPFRFTDTYVIETYKDGDALLALMVTLAIDADKAQRAAAAN